MKMAFAGFCLPPNLLENFDTHIIEFYHRILNKELDLTKKANTVAIKSELKTSFKNVPDFHPSKVQYDSAFKRCAYLFKYAPCITSAVAHEFYELLQLNPSLLLNALKKRRLNVCCIGGGPATTVILALSKMLSAMQDHFWVKSGQALEFSISILDDNAHWEVTMKNILRSLEETPELFDPEKMSLSFKFFKANLLEPLDEKVKEVLENADVVTMVYFVSDIQRNTKIKLYSSAIQEMLNHVKVGALLFYLDNFKKHFYERMNAVVLASEDVRQVYGPHLLQVQLMSLSSIRKYFELYVKHFYAITCHFSLYFSVSAWVKTEKKLKDLKLLWCEAMKSASKQNIKKKKIKSERKRIGCTKIKLERFPVDRKTMEKNNKKVLFFRQEVNKLWLQALGIDKYVGNAAVKNQDEHEFFGQDDIDCDETSVYFPTKSKRKRLFSNPKPLKIKNT